MATEELSKDFLEFMGKLEKYPKEIGLLVSVVLVNCLNGCSWEFINAYDDKQDVLEKELLEYKGYYKSNPKTSMLKLKNGYLVYMDFALLYTILKNTTGGYINDEVINTAVMHRKKALVELDKYLSKVEGHKKLGIYNLNDTNRVVVDGVTYPAFCVALPDVIKYASKYNIKFLVKDDKGGTVVLDSNQLSKGDVLGKYIANLSLSPSNNALFIDIIK